MEQSHSVEKTESVNMGMEQSAVTAESDSIGSSSVPSNESTPVVVDLVKAHTKQLEAGMKLDLRKMHALVGQQVDMKHRKVKT